MLTTVLIVASSVLGTLALVLLVALIRGRGSRTAAQPAAAPAAVPHDLDALAHDLHEALARFQEPQPLPRPVQVTDWDAYSGGEPAPEPEAHDLGELLAQTLETAAAIPGADAALVALSAGDRPTLNTIGLSRQEADRLAGTLPLDDHRPRSISIEYDYGEDDPREGRLERGVAVPVPGLRTPGLVAILTRSPAATLGGPQVELLEQVAARLGPALAAVLEGRPRSPVTITVRERLPGGASAESEERQAVRQVDRFHDR